MDKSQIAVASIFSIRPLAEFSIGDDYESLIWYSKDQEKPTEKEFNDAVTAWNAEYDANQYQRDRQTEYPSWQEQMDLLYHSGVEGLKAELKKTKDKYPKG
jgi:hypothetical protein